MRIALIHLRHARSGGTERYLNLLSAHLAEAGHEPVVVCRSHEAAQHPGLRFVTLRPFSIGGAARLWNFAKAVEAHLSQARYDLAFALGKTWTHDVIRLGGGCHATYLETAHEATRTPLERLLRKGARKNRLALEIERRALAPGAYRQVITNSELTRRDAMARHAIPAERIRVIHNGTDTEFFHPRLREGAGAVLRRSLGWGPAEEVLLFLGTGYGRKGLDLVLEATAELAPRRPALRLLVVGYDSARPTWEARAAKLGLAPRTIFLGGRPDPEACYGAADVYALPTRYDPFANSTIEAMACGLPTITTRANGGSELIDDGVEGSVLSESPTASELAERVAYWFEHRERGAAAARRRAEANRAVDKLEETRRLLEAVAAKKHE
jgi:UDP-glucose:(heptosyl)LPS alpha-1,3-glucosyltransferase